MNPEEASRVVTNDKKCPQCGAPVPAGVLEGLCPACLLKQGAADSGTQPAPTPFEPPPVAEVARLFPQLEIQALIGKGGMGAVYKARQPALDRWVALKILPPQAVGGTSFAERFNREARALARLNHPNIVAVHEFGEVSSAGILPAIVGQASSLSNPPTDTSAAGSAGGTPALLLHYFIMEFIDGVNLRQLQQAGRLAPREALQIVPQICDALQYAHDEGVVHRDIKPENVLVDRKGRVKIADFGLAKILGHDPGVLRLTGEGQVMGTPHYMAPEQIEHPLEVDHRADIYSLGVVFYEMLTGELPLGKFAPPSRKVQVDVRLDEVVLRALEKEPERRYQQASEVKTAVQTVTGSASLPRPGNSQLGELQAQGGEAESQKLENGRGSQSLVGSTAVTLPRLSRTAIMGACGALFAVAILGVVVWVGLQLTRQTSRVIIIGTVTDALTHRPIFHARVSDHIYAAQPDRTSLETWTDINGRFVLNTWYEEHTIAASAPDYEPKLATLTTKPFSGEPLVRIDLQLQRIWNPLWEPERDVNLNYLGDALDLDTGRLFNAPKDKQIRSRPYQIFWTDKSSVNLFIGFVDERFALMTPLFNEVKLIGQPNDQWSEITWQDLEKALALGASHLSLGRVEAPAQPYIMPSKAAGTPSFTTGQTGLPSSGELFMVPGARALLETGLLERINTLEGWKAYLLPTNSQPPLTFAFQTTDGTMGLLQLIRFPTNVNAESQLPLVTLRFKSFAKRPSPPDKGSVTELVAAPFLALLPKGEIEMVAVSFHPSANQPWWRPDGTPSSEGPFQDHQIQILSDESHPAREFVIRLTGLPPDASAPVWKFDSLDGQLKSEEVFVSVKPVKGLQLVAARLLKSARTVTLKVGIGMGPYETVAHQQSGRPDISSFKHRGQDWMVTFTQAEESGGATKITIYHTLNDWDVRVVAMDANDIEHTSSHTLSGKTANLAHITATFAGLSLERVKEFRFQVRPYHWVEFQNVALSPEQHTRVKVLHATGTIRDY